MIRHRHIKSTKERRIGLSREWYYNAYALWKIQEKGRLFVSPGVEVYEGMIIGVHARPNDLVVNPIKGKKLTNIRASGKDEHIELKNMMELNLEKDWAYW
ncbi:MAG: hypothetical protein CM15mP58_17320 [Burkholderiaceae bacterium]|nr:MAG: hypothetical protein CM15mP58_17320 [Burkholderiaceae bacterium]